jgi:hypothetical protein
MKVKAEICWFGGIKYAIRLDWQNEYGQHMRKTIPVREGFRFDKQKDREDLVKRFKEQTGTTAKQIHFV